MPIVMTSVKTSVGTSVKKSVAIRFSTALLCLTLCAAAAAQQSFSSLEERMTADEFRETGLYKLTDEELAALNRWIRARSLAEGEVKALPRRSERARPAARSTQPAEEARRAPMDVPDDGSIASRIKGSFDGWRGGTRFELENGMVWRQDEADTFAVAEIDSPQVVVSPGPSDTWFLRVDGYNRRVRVERVR